MGSNHRILLLDNHDDFGGHAKQNEFHHEGKMVLSLGVHRIESVLANSQQARFYVTLGDH